MDAKRQKCLLFSHICTPNHITGAEKLLLFLAQELQNLHDCMLVVPNEGILSAEARTRGIPVIVYPHPVLWSMYSPGPNLPERYAALIHDRASISSIMKLLHRYRPDFMVVNTCVNPLPAFAGKTMGIPVMWMITETIAQSVYAEHAAQIIERNADRIVGISQSTLKLFQGRAANHRSILYPSWRMDELRPNEWQANRDSLRAELQIAGHERLVGYISSNIYPKKGLDHFLYMAEALCASLPHVKFLIVGTPSDHAFYQQCVSWIAQSPYADRFIRLPFVKRIEDVYPAMDIVVVPSLVEEGFGMTALEGLAFGKPLIAYRSGGLEEMLIQTGNESFLAPAGQWDALAQLAHGLLNDEQLLQESGQRNFTAVQTAFGLDTYRTNLNATVQQLLSTKAAARRIKTGSLIRTKAMRSLFIRGRRRQVYMLDRGVRYPVAFRKRGRIKLKRLPKAIRLPNPMLRAFALGPKISISIKSRFGAKRKKAPKGKRSVGKRRSPLPFRRRR